LQAVPDDKTNWYVAVVPVETQIVPLPPLAEQFEQKISCPVVLEMRLVVVYAKV
jgi:hypothetical protein